MLPFLLIFISILLPFIEAQDCKINYGTVKTITVDASGSGDFQKVQEAIDSVPLENSEWIRIQILPGQYMEKIAIPPYKGCIYLNGAGINNTIIKWGDHESTDSSATFCSKADNILVRGITFENTFMPKKSENTMEFEPAVAVEIYGDKTAFYDCAFIGLQDTLADMVGHHYFKNCYIEGAIDFIFGFAQSIYEDTELVVNIGKYVPEGWYGTITAHGKESLDAEGGFVFKNCKINGVGKALLGRSWQKYATVIFSQTEMADVIVPQGWESWNGAGHESEIIFAEEGCIGPGANKEGRVKWLKTSVDPKYLSLEYINQGGWIDKLSDLV